MSKKVITLFTVITIGLLIGIIILDSSKNKNSNTSVNEILNSKNPVLFYETTCPNCLIVEQFITDNKIDEKITMTKIEVSSPENSQTLLAVGKSCGINPENLGVPLLYADGKCYEGRVDVIKYLSEKAGVVESTSSFSPATQ